MRKEQWQGDTDKKKKKSHRHQQQKQKNNRTCGSKPSQVPSTSLVNYAKESHKSHHRPEQNSETLTLSPKSKITERLALREKHINTNNQRHFSEARVISRRLHHSFFSRQLSISSQNLSSIRTHPLQNKQNICHLSFSRSIAIQLPPTSLTKTNKNNICFLKNAFFQHKTTKHSINTRLLFFFLL